MFLDNLAPGQPKEIRFNLLRNIIAVDAMNVIGMEALLRVTTTGSMSEWYYVPRGSNATADV